MWQRQNQCPRLAFLARLDERRGLRVVDYDEAAFQRDAVAIAPVALAEGLEALLPSPVHIAVESVVECLGDVEEFGVAFHHVPPGF